MPRKTVSEKEMLVSAAAPAPARHKPAIKRVKRTAPAVDAGVDGAVTPVAQTLPVPETTPVPPSQEQIACLAYSYWVERGYQGGSPEEDWLRAEKELLAVVASIA